MKTQIFLRFIALISIACALQSCARTGNDVWEDTKSAGRHMNRGIRAIGGKHGDSRQIRCRSDFECIEEESACQSSGFQDCDYQDADGYYKVQDSYYVPQENYSAASDFVPLQDQANGELAMADMIAPQPRETPGEPGSSVPGIDYFRDPSTHPRLAGIFRNIYFEYNSNLVKGPQNLETVHNVAEFMRRHPNFYAFIEGHADERGPQAYNLALGSRRANAVRNLLISEGVNPDNLFTISYGKERPVVLEHHEDAWSKNRRCEFKIYER